MIIYKTLYNVIFPTPNVKFININKLIRNMHRHIMIIFAYKTCLSYLSLNKLCIFYIYIVVYSLNLLPSFEQTPWYDIRSLNRQLKTNITN